MCPRLRKNRGKPNFEEGEYRVQTVERDVGPPKHDCGEGFLVGRNGD